jgi:hypothetical protein
VRTALAAHAATMAAMQANQLTGPPAPSLRQILSFYGIEHSSLKARRVYLERRDRERAAELQAPGHLAGIEVTEIEPEIIELE